MVQPKDVATNRHAIEEEAVQTILFKMGDETYGFAISTVKEIIKPLPITRFPKSPPYVEGIINLRGHVLPIVNLRSMFGLAPVPITEETRFIDIHLTGLKIGIVVDAVSEVVNISQSMVEAAPPIVSGVDGKFLKGVAHVGDRLVLLLDLDVIFSQWTKIPETSQ